MKNFPRLGFDDNDRKIISFLHNCGLPEPVAQTYMAYLSAPPISLEELKNHWLPALQRDLEREHHIEAVEAFVQVLADNGFLDDLTSEHIESVIRNYINKAHLAQDRKAELRDELPEVMAMLGEKLETHAKKRRQHYLHEPICWVRSPESRDSFLLALSAADAAIKLPAYSGETFFESWRVSSLLVEKLKLGVNVKILFIHPDLGSRLEARPSARKTVEMVKRFLDKVDQERKAFKNAGRQGFGKIEIRWVRQPRFACFTGLLTYTRADIPTSRSSVARLNIHRIGRDRATAGIMIESDNAMGETSLFKVLEAYFDEAWKRAEPLSGPRLWLSRAIDVGISYPGVVLTALVIAFLFYVNAFVATIFAFVYPITLTVLWRRHDESKIF